MGLPLHAHLQLWRILDVNTMAVCINHAVNFQFTSINLCE